MAQEKSEQAKIIVCHISTVHLPKDTRIFYRECGTLVKAGYEVHLVITCEKSTVEDGIHMHACPRPKNHFVRIFFNSWVALWIALKTKARIYHYHDPELMFIGFILRWIFHKKVVFDIHESIPKQIPSKEWIPKLLRKPIVLSYKFIERIFTCGQTLIFTNRGSIPDYTPSVYLVCNYPLINEDYVPKVDAVRKNLEVPLLIYVGNLGLVSGAMIYVELAAKLAERRRSFRMILVGQYTEEVGEKLRSRIEELNLADKVTLTGFMEYKQAMELVAQAAIGMCLFQPITVNIVSLSTKILEYMREGVAVLASDFEGYRYYVEREKAGRNVYPCDIERVADVCEEMLADQDELIAMGQRGIQAVRNKYNWSSEAEVLLRCYKDLLNT